MAWGGFAWIGKIFGFQSLYPFHQAISFFSASSFTSEILCLDERAK